MKQTHFAVLIFLTLLIPLAALGNGVIKGKVVDKSTNEPLYGANVGIEGTSVGAMTDELGEFRILNVPPGTYTVRASYVGYAAARIEGILVYYGLTTKADFALSLKTIEVEEVVIVAQRPLINPSSTNAFRVVTGQDIEAMPVRGMDNILGLIPGVIVQDGNTHIRGGRSDETGFYLEGVSITDPTSGGRSLTIVQDALAEIAVQSGGYDAEFGRANAGIVQHSLKTGLPELKATLEYITDNVRFSGKDQAYSGRKRLGAYWYGYNELTATLSGPIPALPVRFFGMFNYYYTRDPNPQPYPGLSFGLVVDPVSRDSIELNYPAGILLKNSDERYVGTGTMSLDLYPLLLRLSGSWAYRHSFEGAEPGRMLNLGRIPERESWDGFASLKGTYFFNPTSFAELSAGYFMNYSKRFDPALKDNFFAYSDSVANAEAGYIWERRHNEATGRYSPPRLLSVYGFDYYAPGDIISGYQKQRTENFTFTGSFSTQIGRSHTVKLGGDFIRYTLRQYQTYDTHSLAGRIAANDSLTMEEVMLQSPVDNYGYDVLGRSNSEDGLFGPRHPVFASAYIQDKMDFDDLILNVGLRYDYMYSNSYVLVDPARPELTYSFYSTTAINEAGFKKSTPFHGLSPRLGAAFPATDRTVFHVQYAKLIQQAALRGEHVGLYMLRYFVGGIYTNPVGFDLKPTRTTQYEIGFTQQIGDFTSFDLTGYYRDIQDYIVLRYQETAHGSPFPTYLVYANGDFATTKGVELTLTMRRYKRLRVDASLAFQDARGSGSFPNSNRGIFLSSRVGLYTPQYVTPLDYNNDIRGNVNVDYRFGRDDGGPMLEELGASLLVSFNSGHPYTRSTNANYSPVNRFPSEPLNASTTPWMVQFDLRIDKTFRLGANLQITPYIFVINLFNRKNVTNVWPVTGSAEDDGYFLNPEFSGAMLESYGPLYQDMYRALSAYWGPPSNMNNPFFYGPPRQIRLGLRMEY